MRMKLNNDIRPEFRRLLREMKTLKGCADFLGTTWQNVAVMKGRGYMGTKWAKVVETKTYGDYKARMLAKRGKLK